MVQQEAEVGFLKWLGSLVVFTILVGILSAAIKAVLQLLGFSGPGPGTLALILALVIGTVVVLKVNGQLGRRK
jgi:uncharacterized membrane protein YeaQ/YmgE (transglycosylase-associated protein family)